jgi:hypothetical protein
MITPENHNEENHNEENEETRKTIYKETEDGEVKDQGDSSSVADISRTDLIQKPERKHSPLGSSHEPGTL